MKFIKILINYALENNLTIKENKKLYNVGDLAEKELIELLERGHRIKSVLYNIVDAFPANRDWLNPELEKLARELSK